jgi:hypothetical protein
MTIFARFWSLGLRLGLCLGLLFKKFRVTLFGFLTYRRGVGKNTVFQEWTSFFIEWE